jgi:hypothetical protein
LSERFVKPLSLDRILALVGPSVQGGRKGESTEPFALLEAEVEEYLTTSSGSAQDLQPWLQDLEEEVQQAESGLPTLDEDRGPVEAAFHPSSLEDLRKQLSVWTKPLSVRPEA